MAISLKIKRGSGRGLREKLRLFTSGRAKALAANATADALLDLVDEGFRTRSDPYGFPWQERKDGLSHPLLEETRAMRTNFFSLVSGGTVRLENGIPYTGFHQHGTRYMPAREMFPDGPLPPKWKAHIDAKISLALKVGR